VIVYVSISVTVYRLYNHICVYEVRFESHCASLNCRTVGLVFHLDPRNPRHRHHITTTIVDPRMYQSILEPSQDINARVLNLILLLHLLLIQILSFFRHT